MYFGYFFSEEQSWSQTCSEETVLYRDDFKRPPCFVRVKWPVSYRACPLGTSREIYHWEPHQYVKVWMVPNFQCAWEWLRTVSDSRGLSFQAVSSLAHTVHFWFKIASSPAQTSNLWEGSGIPTGLPEGRAMGTGRRSCPAGTKHHHQWGNLVGLRRSYTQPHPPTQAAASPGDSEPSASDPHRKEPP